MSDQSGSSRLRALFVSALEDYEKQTNISLVKHPLAKQLSSCHSVESISSLLQDHARAFSELRGSERILKSIKCIVSFLYKLSATAAFGDNIGLVRQTTLMGAFSLILFYRHSLLRRQYTLAWVFCLLYVSFLSLDMRVIITSECIRRPRM